MEKLCADNISCFSSSPDDRLDHTDSSEGSVFKSQVLGPQGEKEETISDITRVPIRKQTRNRHGADVSLRVGVVH